MNPASSPNLAVKLAEAEKALLAIRQARDSTLEKWQELKGLLSAAEDRNAELTDQWTEALQARETAEKDLETAVQEREELRRKSEELRGNVRDLEEKVGQLSEAEKQAAGELEGACHKVAELTKERDSFRDELAAERATRQEKSEDSQQLAGVQATATQLAEEFQRQQAEQKKKLVTAAAEVSAAHRTRDLAVANVVKAQVQVQHLKSELEAHRRQAKEERMILEAQIVALQVQAGVAPPQPEAQAGNPETAIASTEPGPAGNAAPKAAPTENTPKPLDATETSQAVAEIIAALDRVVKTPSKPSLLGKLDSSLQEFSERARVANLAALHRASSAAVEMTHWLRKTPAKVSTSLPTLTEIVSLLGDLSGKPDIATPAGAIIHAVDDDIDNCECLAMALEKLEFFTKYSVTSKLALSQLEKAPVDLIILDVDLPQMDGFELYSLLRKIPHHADTPILFLSGLISTSARMEELPPGNHAFLSKPYNLTVLGAKATSMIMRRRLAAA
ncbi:MAG TPA: response regulator [Chthoniobacteraceae bacterium]